MQAYTWDRPGSERATLSIVPLVKKMLAQMLDSSDHDRNYLSISKHDKTVLFINNLGGVSPLDLGGILTEVHSQLTKTYGIKPVRIIAGTFMTSLNGLGFSISLLKLVDAGLGVSMLELLDAPAEAVGWTSSIRAKTWESQGEASATHQTQERNLETESQPSNIKSKSATR
jgi:dihydroxyacetone kinase